MYLLLSHKILGIVYDDANEKKNPYVLRNFTGCNCWMQDVCLDVRPRAPSQQTPASGSWRRTEPVGLGIDLCPVDRIVSVCLEPGRLSY